MKRRNFFTIIAGSVLIPSVLKASTIKFKPEKPSIKSQHGVLEKAYNAIAIVEPFAPDMKFEVELSDNLDELYIFVGVKGISIKMRHYQKLIFQMKEVYSFENAEQTMAEHIWKSVQVLRGHKA